MSRSRYERQRDFERRLAADIAAASARAAAEPKPVCATHGRPGFCWDEATGEVRERVDLYHRLAYEYAAGSVEPDVAEAYASWYVQENYDVPLEGAPRHSGEDLVRIRAELEGAVA